MLIDRRDTKEPAVPDLNRRNGKRAEQQGFERLRAELQRAFAVPDEGYEILDAAAVIRRSRGDR